MKIMEIKASELHEKVKETVNSTGGKHETIHTATGVYITFKEYGGSGSWIYSTPHTGISIRLKTDSSYGSPDRAMRLKYVMKEREKWVKFNPDLLLKKVAEVAEIGNRQKLAEKERKDAVNQAFQNLQSVLPSFQLTQEYGDESKECVYGTTFTHSAPGLDMSIRFLVEPYTIKISLSGRIPAEELEACIHDVEAIAAELNEGEEE